MKAEIRIPTTQYGYISLFVGNKPIEEVIETHNLAVKLYEASKGEKPGLPNHQLCEIENNLLNNDGGYLEEELVNLSPVQAYSLKRLQNAIKRATK